MKVVRTVCPVCPVETKVILEEDNLSTYTEDLVRERCNEHPVTAAEKLLAAIFGQDPEKGETHSDRFR